MSKYLTKHLVGRKKEQETLTQILNSKKAEFIALYGRRRVGKTFLIKNFFEQQSCIFFYCSGIQSASMREQLQEFSKQIGITFYSGASITPHQRWLDAFAELTKAIQQTSSTQKTVLFFDELPWMATAKSGLLQALDYYWNRFWTHNKQIKLVICGSSASWIIKKIINNKGGLYNRVTSIINLHPFTLAESHAYLKSQGIKLNYQQILDLYMVLGGIPHYLSLVRKGLSSHQCIDELCFQQNGALVDEFKRLFDSLFHQAENYIALIRIIAQHHYGINQTQLIKKLNLISGGRISGRLKELEDAGFITEIIPYGHKEKGVYYKVIDEFSLFYLRWIEPNKKTIKKQIQNSGFWLATAQLPNWRIWAGYAFETICYKHITQIRKALSIDSGAHVFSWRYSPRDRSKQGAQIDLLFDRNDDTITICEIKYNNQPYVIDKIYAKNLLNKINVFKKHTGTNKQIFIAMITVNGTKPNMYSEEIICNSISLQDLID